MMRKYILLAIILFVALLFCPETGKAAELQLNLNSSLAAAGQSTLNYAELSLQQVVRHDREGRYANAVPLLLIGGGIALLGANNSMDEAALGSFVVGGVIAGLGGLYLLIPSRSELENARVQNIADLAQREVAAGDSLEYLAHRALVKRIVNGITNLGAAGYDVYLYYHSSDLQLTDSLDQPMIYHAVSSIGNAFYNLFFPTYVERVNKRVQQYKAQN